MATKKQQNLLTGAGVLAAATVVVKLISALYKIPLTNLITVEGYAYFRGAYAIYNPLYAISMAGLPVTISKLVSRNMQNHRYNEVRSIFKLSRKLFLCVGIFTTVILAAIAVPYSKFVGSPMNYISILTVAPCILFCCQMSAFRGYYEGMNNMTPTGISRIIEAATKLVVGLAATYFFFSRWLENYRATAVDGVAEVFGIKVTNEAEALHAMYPYAAAIAIAGVTFGSMFGLLYLVIMNKRKGNGITEAEYAASPEATPSKTLLWRIVKLAIPITLTSIVSYVSNIIDDVTIRTRLARALQLGADYIKDSYAWSLEKAQTLDEGISDYLYGIHGSVLNIKNLIPTITLTLGIAAIPVLSKAWTKIKEEGRNSENRRELINSIETALRVCMIIALPAGVGIAVLAKPIIMLMYSSRPDIVPIATPLLRVYGICMFLFAVSSPITSMLRAIGKMNVPLISIAIASAVKIVLNYILIANPKINVNGAPFSTSICYAIMVLINLTYLSKHTGIKLNFMSIFFKPLISAAFCGLGASAGYYLLASKLSLGNTIATLASVCIGGGMYVIVMFIVKGISKNDVILLPKGEKIAKVLEKLHVLG